MDKNKLFEKLFNAAPDPIIIVDDTGCIVMANLEAERKFGFSRQELMHQPVEIIVPSRYHATHVKHRQSYTSDPHTRPMGAGSDLSACRKDGTEFPVEISLSPLETANGRWVISIIRDITDNRRAERELANRAAELARSNAELEQFAYVASHDLQEPLRAIAGSCQLLERRYRSKLDDEAKEFLQFAVDGAKRMQQLISDLLAFSRLTTQGKELRATDCNVVLAQVRNNLRAQIEETNAVVTHETLPNVCADASQLVQLFQNLISNAIKFNKAASPRVEIRVTPDGDYWRFTVTDNGVGIDPKYYEQLFVIFKRLHGRAEYPGTGIGLATCKKIVERHRGTIWIEANSGVGTSFCFTLPATI